jgi:ERCC4-type nuclease
MATPIPLPKPGTAKKASAQAASGLPTVIMDDREYRVHKDTAEALEYAGVPIKCERQDFGDYSFLGCHVEKLGRQARIGIEVSTVSDVVGKINNDRLAFQISNMLLCYDVVILLITAPVQVDREGYVSLPRMAKACTYDRLMNVLNGAQSHGVIVTYADSPQNEHKYLLNLIKYWSKPEDSHKFFRSKDAIRDVVLPVGAPIDKRISNLMTLPGVGEDRAREALAIFGSLRNFYCSGEGAYKLIPGWAGITAAKVNAFVTDSVSNIEMWEGHK